MYGVDFVTVGGCNAYLPSYLSSRLPISASVGTEYLPFKPAPSEAGKRLQALYILAQLPELTSGELSSLLEADLQLVQRWKASSQFQHELGKLIARIAPPDGSEPDPLEQLPIVDVHGSGISYLPETLISMGCNTLRCDHST